MSNPAIGSLEFTTAKEISLLMFALGVYNSCCLCFVSIHLN